jgi:tetratricopeptide (TPR) repeat protein
MINNSKINEANIKHFISVSIENPGYAESQFQEGVLCHNKGHFIQAITYYETAIKHNLNTPAVFYNLAICYYEINEIEHAIAFFLKAIEKKNDFREAILSCCALCLKHGKELHINQRIDEAIDLYLKCLCISTGPQHIALLQHLAGAYSIKGDISSAIKCTIRSLELDPMNAFSYGLLAKLRKFTDKDTPFVQQMELVLKRYTQKEDDQLILYWALGKVNDDINRYNKAFSYYKKANKNFSKKISFCIEKHIQFRNKIIQIFEHSNILQFNRFGSKSKLPLFIVGHNRTGSTLLANKLSMLDNVCSAGELSFFPHTMPKLLDKISELTQESILKMAENYLSILKNFAGNANYVIDKMPVNFVFIGLILILFPEAKIIHCKRHPLDICLSNFFTRYETGNNFSYDLNNIAMYFKEYEVLMQYWYTFFKRKIYTVYYENLISNTEQVGKQLVNWLQLEWNDLFLYHQQNKDKVYTSSFCQVRQKVYVSSVNRWINYVHLMDDINSYLSDEINAYERDLLTDASRYA